MVADGGGISSGGISAPVSPYRTMFCVLFGKFYVPIFQNSVKQVLLGKTRMNQVPAHVSLGSFGWRIPDGNRYMEVVQGGSYFSLSRSAGFSGEG